MPNSSEGGPRRAGKANGGGDGEDSVSHDVEEQELLVYPTDVVVNDEKKTVNMAWFAEQYLLAHRVPGQTNNSHQLSAYVLAKAFPTLPRDKWMLMFSEKELRNDEQLKAFLETARDMYLINVPENPGSQKKRNWKNMVLGYLRKMLYLPLNVGVSQLFFLKLAGLLSSSLDPHEIIELMGGARSLFKMNSAFSDVQEAKYELVIPNDLKTYYQGDGFKYEDLQWVGDVDAFIQVAGPGVPLEEDVNMKSSVYWSNEIDRLTNKVKGTSTTLDNQRKQVADSEKELLKGNWDLRTARSMKQVALKREELVDPNKTPEEKLAELNTMTMTKELFSVELTEEAAIQSFVDLRIKYQEQTKKREHGTSGKRKRSSSPNAAKSIALRGRQRKVARSKSNKIAGSSTSQGHSRRKQNDVRATDDEMEDGDDDDSLEIDEDLDVVEDDQIRAGEGNGKEKASGTLQEEEKNAAVDETSIENTGVRDGKSSSKEVPEKDTEVNLGGAENGAPTRNVMDRDQTMTNGSIPEDFDRILEHEDD